MAVDRPDVSEVSRKLETLLPDLISDLKHLTAIPSIAFPGYPTEKVVEAHDFIVGLLRDIGVENIETIDLPDTSPIVFAEVEGRPNAPTVLLYSHYDVQPPGDESLWTHEPFEPVEEDGVIYGRGVADDKSNLMAHIGALRYFEGKPPVNLKIVFEGQEEFGSPFDYYPPTDPKRFACDAMVIADMGNIRPGVPTFTTALRGDAEVTLEVRTLPEPKHSGEYGGPAPDALVTLIHALSTLHDERGSPAVEGLLRDEWEGAQPIDEAQYREMAGLAADSPLFGVGTIADRLWAGPALTVVGLDAPRTKGGGAGSRASRQRRSSTFASIHSRSPGKRKPPSSSISDAIKPFGIQLDRRSPSRQAMASRPRPTDPPTVQPGRLFAWHGAENPSRSAVEGRSLWSAGSKPPLRTLRSCSSVPRTCSATFTLPTSDWSSTSSGRP